MTPKVTMSWSMKQIIEWRIANKKRSQVPVELGASMQQQNQIWQPLFKGTVKINVDASVVEGQNSFAVGMIFTDYQGQYITGKKMRFACCVQIVEAKLVGILEALLWLEELPFVDVTIQSDSLLSVGTVNKDHTNYLELRTLVWQCKTII